MGIRYEHLKRERVMYNVRTEIVLNAKYLREVLRIGDDGCALCSASRMQRARAHASGEAKYYAAASAASETMLIREVLLYMGLEVPTELLLDSAAWPEPSCLQRKAKHSIPTGRLSTALGLTKNFGSTCVKPPGRQKQESDA